MIDFVAPGSWERLNFEFKSQLGLAEDTRVQCYLNAQHALTEITQSLARTYPHKKKIFYFPFMDPTHHRPLMNMAQDGFDVVKLQDPQLQDFEWVSGLDRETLCVVYSHDDPMLGRRFEVESLAQSLKGKRVFFISIAHSSHLFGTSPTEVDKFQVSIQSESNGLALALCGERVPEQAPVSQVLHWSSDIKQLLKDRSQSETKDLIEKFESQNLGGAKAFFPEFGFSNRLYNRAVIYWNDMDGHAFIDELAQLLGFQLDEPGRESRLETTSLSRWGGIATMNWLAGWGIDANTIRGLVIINANLIDGNLANKITAAREKILKLQSGN